MEPAAADIFTVIEAAFPARRASRFTPMVNSVQGEEPLLTATAFSDKDDWTQLDGKWLDEAPGGWATALNFLADEAVCFYIPAYIAANLRGALERVDPAFHLTHGFDNFSRNRPIHPRGAETWTDYGKRRWSHLTTKQASAIVRYLEWRLARDVIDIADDVSEALAAFWYDRASAQWNVG